MAGKKLPPKQQRFAEEYAIDWNATQAAIRAGYSPESAASQACRLLRNVKVQRAVQMAQRAIADRAEIRGEAVLRELAALGFSDITDYILTDKGKLRLRSGVPRSATRAVASIKRKVRRVAGSDDPALEDVETEIKLWNKIEPLKKLGEYTGIFEQEAATAREPLELQIEVIDRREQVRAELNESDATETTPSGLPPTESIPE